MGCWRRGKGNKFRAQTITAVVVGGSVGQLFLVGGVLSLRSLSDDQNLVGENSRNSSNTRSGRWKRPLLWEGVDFCMDWRGYQPTQAL